MRITLLAAILAGTSFSAISAPYIGLEYGFGSTSHDAKSNFTSSPVKLNPSDEDGILSGFIGYSLTPSWAIEFGYSQYNLDDERSKFISSVPGPTLGSFTVKEEEWEAHVKAKQFTLVPVYTHNLNDKWQAKFKAGLTYTQYDVSGSHYFEFEHEPSDIETIDPQSSYSNSSNEIGGLISVGTEYEVYPQLTLGANVKYQFDSFANTASFNIGSTYYF